MTNEVVYCSRGDQGHLILIGENAGGYIYKCFLCESQVSILKPGGADVLHKVADTKPRDESGGAGPAGATRGLEAPVELQTVEPAPSGEGEEPQEGQEPKPHGWLKS